MSLVFFSYPFFFGMSKHNTFRRPSVAFSYLRYTSNMKDVRINDNHILDGDHWQLFCERQRSYIQGKKCNCGSDITTEMFNDALEKVRSESSKNFPPKSGLQSYADDERIEAVWRRVCGECQRLNCRNWGCTAKSKIALVKYPFGRLLPYVVCPTTLVMTVDIGCTGETLKLGENFVECSVHGVIADDVVTLHLKKEHCGEYVNPEQLTLFKKAVHQISRKVLS